MAPAPEPPTRLNASVRELVLRLAIVIGFFFAVGLLSGPSDRPHRATFADFLAAVERGDIEHAVLETSDNSLRAEGTDGRVYAVGYPPSYATAVVDELQAANVDVDVKPRGPAWLARTTSPDSRRRHRRRLAPGQAPIGRQWRGAARGLPARAGARAVGGRAEDDVRGRRRR